MRKKRRKVKCGSRSSSKRVGRETEEEEGEEAAY